ncbi:MAG: TonB-dependent receptor [Bacteroidetes bacterium]|nr:TonB-dependent receptor [Bacteroidota bacterium]MBS1756257.1 TonB-dependent receptor [Bacteroidota bacterium]
MSKKLTLFTCLILSAIFSMAQSKVVKGRVVDENGAGLQGVTVLQRGSKTGTQTDAGGNFSLPVSAATNNLIFSSVGFTTKTVNVSGRSTVNVTLSKNITNDDEVVVVGYQSVKRKDLLASVSSVGAKDLKDIPINSAAEALNGRLAGVTATTSEGSPDATIKVRVRGGMSITQDNSPLYIVDGVQIENALSTLSPQDIQSIDVLKDAAATAIYGARGANGVIVITTKSGRQGRLRVAYNAYVGVKSLSNKLKVLDPYDFVIYQYERSRGSSTDSSTFAQEFGTTWDTLSNYKNVTPVDWQKEIFGNTGFMQTHNVSLSGGSKKFVYNFGYTFNEDKAVVINSKYLRHLLNFRGDYKVTQNLKFGITARLLHQDVFGAGVSDDKGTSYNRLRNTIRYRPFLSPNQAIDEADPFADPNVGNGLILINPLQLASMEYRKKTTDADNITLNGSYNITKHLSFRSTFGFNYNKAVDRQFSDSLTPYAVLQGSRMPIASLDTIKQTIITNSNVLNYNYRTANKKHNFDALLGQETYQLSITTTNQLYKGFPLNTTPNQAFKDYSAATSFTGYPRLAKTKYTNLSYFGRINYSFEDKYLASFNMRADGASKFGPGNKWGYFPAGSLAWRVTKEKFMSKVKFINDLKLRFGYGVVGNNRIPDYLYISTFSSNGNYFYGLNNQAIIAYYSNSLVNPNLKWESTINRNFGIDLSLLRSRINLSVDIYNNTSKDLLLNVPIASTYGYSTQLQNIGRTSNKGVELQLSSLNVSKKDFSWNSNLNLSFNKNKILALGTNQTSYFPPASWGVSGQPADYIVKVGSPVGAIWGLVNDGFYTVNDFDYNTSTGEYTLKAGVVSDKNIIGTVQPGSIKFKDLNNDGSIDVNKDDTIIGNPNPKFTGGFNNQFTYKRWDMSVFVNFSYGNDVYNANKVELSNGYTADANLLQLMQGRWKTITPDGQVAQYVNSSGKVIGIAPDQLSALNANASIWQPVRSAGAFYPSSWAIEDGSFLRINNITLGYTFPAVSLGKLKMSKLRLYFTANNLGVFTSYTGYDPEVSVRSNPVTPGLDYSAYPKSKSFIFGVNASF